MNPQTPRIMTRLLPLTALFTALTAAGAFLKMPFYPVPITLQTFFTLSAAAFLPARWAAGSQLLYLVVGLLGLPVFANGGGPAYALQPSFGYLVLLPPLSYLTAKIGIQDRTALTLFVILLAVQCLHLFGGSLWLFINLQMTAGKSISFTKALLLGAVFFLPGAVLKAAVLTWLNGRMRPIRHFFSPTHPEIQL